MPDYVILVTGASSGFGQATAEALATAGHTAYAAMRDVEGRNAAKVARYADWGRQHSADLRTVELDVRSDASVDAVVERVIADAGRLDVIVHNAGHMVFRPLEAFTTGTNHFSNAGKPSDTARAAEHENGPYAGVADRALEGFAALSPPDADPGEVACQIVRIVDTPFGKRPFRGHIDPARDGVEEVNAVADRMRRKMSRDIGLADLLSPHTADCSAHGNVMDAEGPPAKSW